MNHFGMAIWPVHIAGTLYEWHGYIAGTYSRYATNGMAIWPVYIAGTLYEWHGYMAGTYSRYHAWPE